MDEDQSLFSVIFFYILSIFMFHMSYHEHLLLELFFCEVSAIYTA